jgi:probable F420-dependent oxidoreductase
MKFSISLPTCFEGVMYPIPFIKPDEFIPLARLCEKLGYDSVWGNDHITTQNYVRELFPGKPPNFYEPLVVMAAIAGQTTKLRLGTSLLVLPMRDPVYLAKQVTTLDQICNGRFILGVGLGAYREEFAAWNALLAKQRRGEMMDEGLAALTKLLNEPRCSHDGRHYAFKDIEMFPKSARTPFALYVGGHNLEAVERAARYGQGWLPGWRPLNEMAERIKHLKARAAELGRDPDDIEVAPQFSFTIAKTLEQAERSYMASGLVAHRKSLAYTGRDLGQQVVANLVGSADVILEKVAALKAMGVEHCSSLMVPANTMSEYIEQIEWFAEAILPRAAA